MNFRYSYMAKLQKPKLKPAKVKLKTEQPSKQETEEETNEFDFGGLPKDVPFKRNIGCGG